MKATICWYNVCFAKALVKVAALLYQSHVLHWDVLFAANIAVEQEIIVAAIMIDIYIFTLFSCTPIHVRSKPSSDFALRHRLQK